MFRGSLVALITPFRRGQIDDVALRRLVDWHVAEGTHGIVACATTGEAPTLSHEEHDRVLKIVVEEVQGGVPVIAGAGSNNTSEALELTRSAERIGAVAALHVTGYYNKPTQEQHYRHFKLIHDATGIPIIIYNIPSRTGIEITVETMAKLAALPRVVGVKDATGNVGRLSDERLKIGSNFAFLSGDDATSLGYMAHGGQGCISVTANVAPRLCADFHERCLADDFVAARILNDRLMPLHRALFIEPNPAGVKCAAELLGLCDGEIRPPMGPVERETRERIHQALTGLQLSPIEVVTRRRA